MDKIKIVTDSTSDLSPELLEKYGIEMLPLYVHIGEETYRDGDSITLEELFRRIKEGGPFPTTSQVNPQDFHDVYKKYLDEGYKIISLHISSQLSGTVQSAMIAKGMLESDDIEIIDCEGLSGTLMLNLVEAGEMVLAGKSMEEVVEGIKANIPKMKVLVSFDTLENLIKGGRLGKAAGTLGGILGLKPLITLKGGKLEVVDKVRGAKKAQKALLSFLDEAKLKPGSKVVLINAINDTMRPVLIENLESRGIGYYDVKVGCVLGVHAGPGLMGAMYMEA